MKNVTVMVPVTIDCNCADGNGPSKKILARMAADAIAHQLRLQVLAGTSFNAEGKFTYSVDMEIHARR